MSAPQNGQGRGFKSGMVITLRWLLEPVCKIFDFPEPSNKTLLFLVRHRAK